MIQKKITSSRDDLYHELQKWRDSKMTYKQLRQRLNQYSVFAGRNVLVSMIKFSHLNYIIGGEREWAPYLIVLWKCIRLCICMSMCVSVHTMCPSVRNEHNGHACVQNMWLSWLSSLHMKSCSHTLRLAQGRLRLGVQENASDTWSHHTERAKAWAQTA